MSTFDTIFHDAGAPIMQELFGSSGTVRYMDPSTEPVPLTARLSASMERQEPNEQGGTDLRTTRTAVIGRDPTAAGGGIANPKRTSDGQNVLVEIGGVTWVITAIQPMTETEATLHLQLLAGLELGRDKYQ